MKIKKIPMRMCLGCNEMKNKRDMLRVVKSPEGNVSLDFTGKKSGRGAYICKTLECFEAARRAKRFERSLSCRIDEKVYEELKNEFAAENYKHTDHMP